MNKEQEKLVTDNINLIYYTIQKINGNIDELLDIGYISLCESALSYKKDIGIATFSTYATKCMLNCFNEYYRSNYYDKRKANSNTFSIYANMNNSNEEELSLVDILSDNVNFEEEVVHSIIIDNIIHLFSENKKYATYLTIVKMLLNGYKQCDIANALGKSKQNVNEMIKNIRKIIIERGII